MDFGPLTVRPDTFIDVYFCKIYEKRNLKITKMYVMYVLWSGWWWGSVNIAGKCAISL